MNNNATVAVAIILLAGVSAWFFLGGPSRSEAVDTAGDGLPADKPHSDPASNGSVRPLLAGEPDAVRIARLERDLARAKAKLAAGESKQPDVAETTTGTAPSPAQPAAELRTEYTALIKRMYAGTATEEDVARLTAFNQNPAVMKKITSDLLERIADNPDDVEARLELADVDSSRLHTAASIVEKSLFRRRINEQLTEVLQRDKENEVALYRQAVGASHSRRDEVGRAQAISKFEALRAIQERGAPTPTHAKTYFQLALVHQAGGNGAQAREVVMAGLQRVPDDEELTKLLAGLAGKK